MNNLEIINTFLDVGIAERGFSKNTIESYKRDLKQYFQFLDSKALQYDCVTPQNILEYVASLGTSASSTSRKLSTLRQFYKFLLSEKYISSSPLEDIDSPKAARNLPKSLNVADIEKLKYALADNKRDFCIFYLMYATGMRISEVLSLKISDLAHPIEKHGDTHIFVISGKGNKERIVILDKAALDVLTGYLKTMNTTLKTAPYLFPSKSHRGKVAPLTRQMFFINLKKAANDAGLDPELVSPHKIRHSFATHLLASGANLRVVQDLMGHSNISSTQIYTKVMSEQAMDLLKKHPLNKVGATHEG